MTTVRLNDDLDNKLGLLKDVEKTTKTEIIKRAILEYYDHHIQEKSPFELGKDLFGKNGSDENLSKNYKSRIKEKLNEKHSH
jgi:predicted DNA-binding protein